MGKLIFIIFLALLIPCQSAWAQDLSQKTAVALAEKFITENGYTNVAQDRAKRTLDLESIERTDSRSEMLKQRYNTLQTEAIGAKRGRRGDRTGWSIAFDYSPAIHSGRDSCRVVTMDRDGSNIRIEHVDGIRSYFAGFN